MEANLTPASLTTGVAPMNPTTLEVADAPVTLDVSHHTPPPMAVTILVTQATLDVVEASTILVFQVVTAATLEAVRH